MLRMEVGTVWFLTFINLSTRVHFVVKRVIFLFLPPVRELAPILMLATICISLNEVLSLPLRTLFFFIVKDMRLPSEVLPIVSINAGISWMVSIAVGAPNSFEVEHVKVRVLLELV
jgi:hypothetical protein